MANETIVRGIDLAADKPFGPRDVPLENFFPWLKPVQFLGSRGPKRLGVFVRGLEYAGALNVSCLLELLWRRKISFFIQQNLDRFVCHGVASSTKSLRRNQE